METSPVTRAAEERTLRYAEALGQLIRTETVREHFHEFREQLRGMFPALFGLAEYAEYEDSFTLRWAGQDPERISFSPSAGGSKPLRRPSC